MDDEEKAKEEAFESMPQISAEQVPTKDETSKELLYGSNDKKKAKNQS